MVRRNDDIIILSDEHLALLNILRTGPVFDFELSKRFGDGLSSMLRDLRTNDHPIHSGGARSASHPDARIHYHEKPGSELAPCMICKKRRRAKGPFCSDDCQLAWEKDRLSRLSTTDLLSGAEKDRRSAKIPEEYREAFGITEEPVMIAHARRSGSAERLSTAILPHIIYHLAKKAAVRRTIPGREISTMVRVGGQLYNGLEVSEGDMRELDIVLARCLDVGIIEAGCHDTRCGMCRRLNRDLDYLQDLRDRMRDVAQTDSGSPTTHDGRQAESRILKFIRGSPLFHPLPERDEAETLDHRRRRWITRRWR